MAVATISELQAVSDRFDELFGKQEFQAIAEELHTSDVRFMAPGCEIIIGRKGIAEAYQAMYTDTQVKMKSTVVEVMPGGDDAMIERGSYSFYDRDGEVTYVGKFLVLLKKIDDRWFVHWELFNSDKS